MVQVIQQKLLEKSADHTEALRRLTLGSISEPISNKVLVLEKTPQLRGMNTIIHDTDTNSEDFIFYFDRTATLLVEQYVCSSLLPAMSLC